MGKMYTVVMDKKVVLGPTANYAEVKEYVGKLSPADKAKCSVQVKNEGAAAPGGTAAPAPAAAAPAQQQPPAPAAKKETPPPAAKKGAPAADKKAPGGSNADAAFSSFLSSGGTSDLWKPKDGRNLIRILPAGGLLPSDWQTPYPFLVTGVHSNVGLSLNDTVYCARLTHGKACPICNFSWNLYNSKNEDDKALSKNIRAYRRVLANILDMADLEAGVQKFAFGKKLAEKILSYKQDSEYIVDGKDFLDPEVGRNFVLIKKMVDKFPNYDDSRPEVKITPLSSMYPNWQAECHDLSKELAPKSYDELMAILADTKKAMLSTDPSEWGHGRQERGTGAPAGGQAAADTSAELDGVPIVEEGADDVKNRLDRL